MSRSFRASFFGSALAVILTGCMESSEDVDEASTSEAEQAIVNCTIAWEKELMITDVRVVGDARARNNGPWSFGGIFKALAGNRDEQQFLKSFVETWMQDQIVDGVTVKARPRIKELVLDPWRAQSGGGTYDLAKAPFELLAIVYRVDLRRQNGVGDGAGEGRFVFGVRSGDGRMMPFTVIAEFGLPTNRGKSAADWANEWHTLGQYELGSVQYNQRLEVITNLFVGSPTYGSSGGKTNLNQLRTNEIALMLNTQSTPLWELREFHIESDGLFHPARPARTPMNEMNGTSMLGEYVRANAGAITKGKHKVPIKFRGVSFTAGASIAPTNAFTWNVPGVSVELQKQFSTQTCNGCHAGDTGTNFLHVGPSFTGGAARLSDFVLNTEMPRRVASLKELMGCQ